MLRLHGQMTFAVFLGFFEALRPGDLRVVFFSSAAHDSVAPLSPAQYVPRYFLPPPSLSACNVLRVDTCLCSTRIYEAIPQGKRNSLSCTLLLSARQKKSTFLKRSENRLKIVPTFVENPITNMANSYT